MDRESVYVYQQIEQTTEKWATNETVYPASIWLFERLVNGKFNMKLSDGVSKFSALKTVFQDVKVVEKTNSATEYVLTVTTAEGSFDTPNLKGKAGSVVTINPDNKHLVIDGVDTGVKIEGVDGQSAYELWLTDPDNAGKTEDDYITWQQKPAVDAAAAATIVITATNNAKDAAILATAGANNAATAATEAAEAVEDGKTPVVEIGTVTEGEEFSASITPNGVDANGNPKSKLNLVFKPGESGKPAVVDFDVLTGEAGTEVKVEQTQTGTTPDGSPIYSVVLTIPRGDKGAAGEGSGNVLVDATTLLAGKTYLFKPKFDGNSEGDFVLYTIPDVTEQIATHNSDTASHEDIRALIKPSVQSDWNQVDLVKEDFIKNKPTKLSQFTNDSGLIGEAPLDGKLYARKDKTWAEAIGTPEEIHIGAEAPTGKETIWVDTDDTELFDAYAVPEAPADGKLYGRKDKIWNEIVGRDNVYAIDWLSTETGPVETVTQQQFDDLRGAIEAKKVLLLTPNYITSYSPCVTSAIEESQIVLSFSDTISLALFKISTNLNVEAESAYIIKEAPADDKQYARKNKSWTEVVSSSGTVYLDVSEIVTGNGFTELASDEFIAKVIKAYNDYAVIIKVNDIFYPGYVSKSGDAIYNIYMSLDQLEALPSGVNCATQITRFRLSVNITSKSITMYQSIVKIDPTGDGNKVLTNDGSYDYLSSIGVLDLSPLKDADGNDVTTATPEFMAEINKALAGKYTKATGGSLSRTIAPMLIFDNGVDAVTISTFANSAVKDGPYVSCITAIIYTESKSISYTEYQQKFIVNGFGEKALMDDGTYKPVISPTDVATLTSLSSLSKTKYSQKYTYTTTTAQGINFASAPEEGFECMLDIKNGTSSQITQAIPNAAAWQCEETSLVIPAGKVGCISIRYVHGKYCVRVGL